MKKTIICTFFAMILMLSMVLQISYANTEKNPDKKTVLVIATHCDDEANIAYSVVRANILAGNDVYVTNHSLSGIRGPESMAAMEVLGLPRENFLVTGVGTYNLNGNLAGIPLYYDYNMADRDTLPSGTTAGLKVGTESGTIYYPSWPALHMGGELTKSVNDTVRIFADIFITLKPDEIYCIDQDNHPGHRTTSYLVEDAICKVLKENEGYTPRVYKGFSYMTAWVAKRDFYSVSPDDSSRYYLKSTLIPNGSQNDYVFDSRELTPYKWSERVRFAMPEGLQTADKSNLIFDVLKCYKSQLSESAAESKAQSVGNGDKVFWERDTRGISYKATVEVSSNSEIKQRVNDFHLNDRRNDDGTGNITGSYANYTWKPAEDDSEKTVSLSWSSCQNIKKVTLYDDQNMNNQITEGELQFYNEEKLVYTQHVDALENGGDGTEIILENAVNADKVSFKILAGSGDYGISEMEVYTQEGAEPRQTDFIKIYLANDTEDFLYNYPVKIVGKDKKIDLSVYRYPDENPSDGYKWSLEDDAEGKLTVENGTVFLDKNLPQGEYVVKVEDLETGLTDSITLSVINIPTLDISDGSITITDDGYRQGSGALVKWKESGEHVLTITGSFDGTATEAAEARYIDIKGGNPEISFEGTCIKQNKSQDKQNDAYMKPAILLEAGQEAKLKINGGITLEGGYKSPAIQINQDATLIIEGRNSGTDKLTVKGGNGDYVAIGAGNSQTPYAAQTEVSDGNLILRNLSLFAYSSGSSNIGDSDVAFGDITVENIALRCYGSVAGAIKTGGTFNATGSSLYVSNGIYAKGGYGELQGSSFLGTGGAKVSKISTIIEGDGYVDTWLCKRSAYSVSVSATAADGSYLESLTAVYNDGTEEKTLEIKNGTFKMPEYDVTIKAVFKEIPAKELNTLTYNGETAAAVPKATDENTSGEATVDLSAKAVYDDASEEAITDAAAWELVGSYEGIGLSGNKLTIDSTAKAVDVTVKGTYGGKEATATISLSKEESEAAYVKVTADNTALTAPKTGGTAAAAKCTAEVKDQYGAVMEGASVTWTIDPEPAANIEFAEGTLTVNAGAKAATYTIKAVSGAKEGTVQIAVSEYTAPSGGGSYVPPVQKPVIEKNDNVKTELSSDGTKLTIEAEQGYKVADVTVNGVSKGAVTTLTGLKTGDKVVIVTEKIQTEPTVEEVEKDLAEYALVARSKAVTVKNGKKAIKITWYDKNGKELNLDGVEIYRSTKRYSGYGKKPVFTSKTGQYYNTAIKPGTKYYYKVRGYKVIDGEKYYTEYSLKAWRKWEKQAVKN